MALQEPEEIAQPTPIQSDYSTAKCNFNATVAPTVNDDETLSYAPNSFWYRTDTNQVWQCVYNTEGAAVWNEIGTHGNFLKIGNVIQNAPTVSGVLYVGASNTLLSSPALGALQSARRNAGNTAMEAFTPQAAFTSQSQNLFFASPNGSSGNPSFRAIAAADFLASVGANRLMYLNGSSAPTSNASLTFDGTKLTIGNAPIFSPTSRSFFAGSGAGANRVSGDDQIGIGNGALGGALTGSYLLAFGAGAGASATSASNGTYFGTNSGGLNVSGSYVFYAGGAAGYNLLGSNNTMTGEDAGRGGSGATASYDTGYGYASMYSITSGTENVGGGHYTLYSLTTGSYNTMGGGAAGYSLTTQSYNSYFGHRAGFGATGSGGVFIGYNAGYNETGSNKLYIANSSTANPLIYGDFSAGLVKFNGDFELADGKNINLGSTLGTAIGGGSSKLSFFGNTPVGQPNVTGAKDGNAALDSLLTKLALLGIISDSTDP